MKIQNCHNCNYSHLLGPRLRRFVKCGAILLTAWLFLGAPGTNRAYFSAMAAEEGKKAETLTNKSIMDLQQLNLGDDVILEKIKTSQCDFDVSVDGLKQLKEANVSAVVIKAMISPKAAVPVAVPAAVPAAVAASGPASQPEVAGDPNDPNAPHGPGVYLYEETGGQKKMTKIMPESPSVSGGAGPFGGSERAVLTGLSAKLELTTRKPVFYMFLGTSGDTQLAGGVTPAQLPLAQFDLKDNKKVQERSVVIGSHAGGPFSSRVTNGLEEKSKRPFDAQEIRPGVYKITLQNDLPDGEYGFVKMSGGFESASGQMFCFGIHPK